MVPTGRYPPEDLNHVTTQKQDLALSKDWTKGNHRETQASPGRVGPTCWQARRASWESRQDSSLGLQEEQDAVSILGMEGREIPRGRA